LRHSIGLQELSADLSTRTILLKLRKPLGAVETPTSKKSPSPLWYAVHVVFYYKTKRRRQATFLAMENVYLVNARSGRKAAQRAEKIGLSRCLGAASLKVNGQSATLEFGGIRKVISCAADPYAEDGTVESTVSTLYDGVEATYSTYVVRGRKDLKALIAGHGVPVLYEET
jgi:Domain of unknown function (DUF4288)